IASVLPRKPHDHLSGLDDGSSAWPDLRDHAGCVRLELRETHQVVCGLQLRFGRVELSLSGLKRLIRLVPDRTCSPTLLQQRVLTFKMILRLGQLRLSSRKIGFRRT